MAIEIVDFPMKNGGPFHSYVNVYQRVKPSKKLWVSRWISASSRSCQLHVLHLVDGYLHFRHPWSSRRSRGKHEWPVNSGDMARHSASFRDSWMAKLFWPEVLTHRFSMPPHGQERDNDIEWSPLILFGRWVALRNGRSCLKGRKKVSTKTQWE